MFSKMNVHSGKNKLDNIVPIKMSLHLNHLLTSLLGDLAKLRTGTISFVMFVRLFIRPSVRMEQLGSLRTDFHEIQYLRIFRKSVVKFQVSLKSFKNKRYFTWRPIYIFIISRSFLLRIRNVSDKVVQKIKTHLVFSNFFFSKIMPFMR
jgi:hypothetical protein